MTEPRRPEPPPSPRKGVQGGQIDVSRDVQQQPAAPDPSREGGMIGEAGEPPGGRERRDGGMIGEG